MRATTDAISIKLTRDEGMQLRSQIIKLAGGTTMELHAGDLRGTPLAHLFELLSGNFENSTKGVNFTE
jgi:hypothetical protein